MKAEVVQVELEAKMMQALEGAARTEQMDVSDIARKAVQRELERIKRDAEVAAENAVAESSAIRDAIAESVDWIDLKARLRRAGFMVRRSEAGIGVVSVGTGEFSQWPVAETLSIQALQDKFGPANGIGCQIPRWAGARVEAVA